MIRAALETAARGHEVHVVSWCFQGLHRGVLWHDNPDIFDVALERGPWDAVVVWGEPEILPVLQGAGALEGTLRVVAQQCNGFTRPEIVRGYVDLVVSPSRPHAAMLASRYAIPAEKFVVIPNAVEPSRFRSLGVPRNPFAVYHASSPDRGLHHLLELWPEIRKAEPRAELHVYYEMERFFRTVRGENGEDRYSHPIMLDLVARLEAARNRVTHGYGVTFHGARPQQDVADRACTAGVMCYPCDPVIFTEGFGTAVLEGYVAGAVPVTTDADAFGDVYGDLFPLIPRGKLRERLVPEVLQAIEAAVRRVEAKKVGWAFGTIEEHVALAAKFSWARVGGLWCDAIERGLSGRRGVGRVAA